MIDFFIRSEHLSTRKHIILWLSIWLALFITTWYCRYLLPFHETAVASNSWNLKTGLIYQDKSLELHANNFSFLLNYLEVLIWKITGPSEFSIRLLSSVFSLGSLLLTAWAAKQLWPNDRKTRTSAPLILIGSLIWTFFATAHINSIPLSFFSLLTVNFIIYAWKQASYKIWLFICFSLILGLFSNSIIFLFYVLPVALTMPFWDKKRLPQEKWFIKLFIVTSVALVVFFSWGFFMSQTHRNISIWMFLGIQPLFSQLYNDAPLGIYLLSLPFILFPWALWPPLYKNIKSHQNDASIRFCLYWFFVELFVVALLGASLITSLLPLYPVFALIIAKTHKPLRLRYLDALPIALTSSLVGIALFIIPIIAENYQLPRWVGHVSPLWGLGLILLSIIFIVTIKKARLETLALMSVALTIALNFGIVRQSQEFYDVHSAAERIAWYEQKNYPIAHRGRYLGQFHFAGLLNKEFTVLKSESAFLEFKKNNPKARIILYLPKISPSIRKILEYRQPFRGQFIVIVPIEHLDSIDIGEDL